MLCAADQVFHGIQRNAAEYRSFSVKLADHTGALIMVPKFDAERWVSTAAELLGAAYTRCASSSAKDDTAGRAAYVVVHRLTDRPSYASESTFVARSRVLGWGECRFSKEEYKSGGVLTREGALARPDDWLFTKAVAAIAEVRETDARMGLPGVVAVLTPIALEGASAAVGFPSAQLIVLERTSPGIGPHY
jgi:hypothetical protein